MIWQRLGLRYSNVILDNKEEWKFLNCLSFVFFCFAKSVPRKESGAQEKIDQCLRPMFKIDQCYWNIILE